MKLDNYGIFVISNLLMRQMSISYLLDELRTRSAGWEMEQRIILDWIRTNHPLHYQSVVSGDIDASVLLGAACHVSGTGLVEVYGASIWVNGHRAGVIEYTQTREFSKMTAIFYRDPSLGWLKDAFLERYPGFKRNIKTHMWVRYI